MDRTILVAITNNGLDAIGRATGLTVKASWSSSMLGRTVAQLWSAHVLCALVCFASVSLTTPAESEQIAETSETGASVESYPGSFFTRFNPQSARDMIDRLPGFALDTGNAELRGFGSTAGNVLINGERPSSKSGGVEDALRRIPAAQVDRIELIRGTAGASEAAGQAIVANIIRVAGVAAGSWELKIERAADGIVYPGGELTYANLLGDWETSTKINAFWERFPLAGPRLQFNAEGALTSSQLEDRPSVLTQAYVSSEAERPFADGALRLTGRIGRSAFLPDTERLGFDQRLPDDNPDDRFEIDFDSVLFEGEGSIDWSRPLSNEWTLKLLSLSSLTQLEDDQVVTVERPIGHPVAASTFQSNEDTFETVLRATVNKGGEHRLQPEFGAEITYNRLDSELALLSNNGGSITAIELPAANVRVEEIRGEAFANLIWRATSRLIMESGVGLEVSEISVSGDAENSQTFVFAKPFASVVFDPKPGLQFRFGARHSVGQLDFSQFAASAEAADDRFLGGNPDLGPDQTTRASLTVDLRAEQLGALNIEAFHEWRRDAIEQVLLPSGVFGAANAGDGRIWGVTANANVSLSPIIPDAQIEIEADVRDSTFPDPLTGQARAISGINSPTILVEFRQDLSSSKVSWGASYLASRDARFFFGNEESFFQEGEQWSLFIETTRWFGIRTNLALRNIGERDFTRERLFFAPSRADSLVGSESISRSRGMFVTLTMGGQF